MLLTSFFPLAILILSVLGAILFGLATPSEAAAIGALGGLLLAAAYRRLTWERLHEFGLSDGPHDGDGLLAVRRVVDLRVGLLLSRRRAGDREFVVGLDMTPLQFLLLAQLIIFLLGWPLEWSEIIIIFVPIFLPLLPLFDIDPLFFGILIALNLQTSFLTPPMAMSAYYLKGIAPPHVRLTQIFAGSLPYVRHGVRLHDRPLCLPRHRLLAAEAVLWPIGDTIDRRPHHGAGRAGPVCRFLASSP